MHLVKTLIDPLCAMLVLYIEKNAESRPLPQEIYGKILSIIHTGYSRKLRLTDIAAQCHYSVAFICRYFKNVSGESIGEYLHNVRMQKALKLILESKMPIGDVASACGFSDANYFISAFSNYYGSPPGKYRRENSK